MLTAQQLALMDDEHLISSLHATFDPLTSTPAEIELLRRFEELLDSVEPEMADALAEYDFDATEIGLLGKALHGDVLNTTAMLDALGEAEITSVGELKRRLELAEKFEALIEDAGDVFARLSQLAQTTQE